MKGEDLGARVQHLEATRGRYDAAELAFLRRLVDAAADDAVARPHLEARARSALEHYEARVEATRQRSAEALARLPESPPSGSLGEAYAEGDYLEVLRQARRLGRASRRGAAPGAREPTRPALVARLRGAGHGPGEASAEARPSRGVGVVDGDSRAAAERRYRARAAERVTRGVLESARGRLPPQAGPYHGPSVALRALEDLGERYRPLLQAWLLRLDGLDAATPPAPAPSRFRRR